ncbi:MAG: ribosome maturation factor RimM [Spirochaetota bacterium]
MSTVEYLRIGKITGTHGLEGRLKVYIITDDPDRFDGTIPVYVNVRGNHKKFHVDEFIPIKPGIGILRFRELPGKEKAQSLTGCEVFIDIQDAEKSRKNLDSDTYFYYDIIGCRVFLNGNDFGVVHEIVEAASNDVLVIMSASGREYMIPFVENMVDTANIRQSRIDISPVEGLLEIQE